MNKKRTKLSILMTGATGFLGSNIATHLLRDGHCVTALKRSFSNLFRLRDLVDQITFYNLDEIELGCVFGETRYDVIIHCATDYGRKERQPIEIIEANLFLPLSLLQFAVKEKVPCFINTDTILEKDVNYYALSKKQFLEWLMTYADRLKIFNVCLEHLYGPHDDGTKFVTSMLHKLITGVDVIELTPGEQRRQFIYIDDVVSAFMTILKSLDIFGDGLHLFDIGTDQSTSIKELLLLAKELASNKETVLNFGAFPYRLNETMDPKIDISKIKELGWVPKVSLQDGLRRTILAEQIH